MQKTIVFFLFFLTFVKNALLAQSVVAASKMNILYIGVENKMRFGAVGVPLNELEVTASGTSITKGSSGNVFILNPTTPGEATVTVSHKGKAIGNHTFRVKRIPDPYIQLPLNNRAYNRGGNIPAATFRSITLLTVEMEDFELETPCTIQRFDVTYVARSNDPVTLSNSGSHFSAKVLDLVKRAEPSNVFYFDNVKARCPGDVVGRETNALFFKMK
jgi:hypothetical protein